MLGRPFKFMAMIFLLLADSKRMVMTHEIMVHLLRLLRAFWIVWSGLVWSGLVWSGLDFF